MDDLKVGDLVRCTHEWYVIKKSDHGDFLLIRCRWCHTQLWERTALLEKVSEEGTHADKNATSA